MRMQSRRRSTERALLAALLLLAATFGAAQPIVENPKTPESRNAGRVLPLKEVARITDEKGKFFFVTPFNVFTGSDGSVYVQDYTQLLKFDREGRFVGNLVKKGQGPGELDDNLTDVLVREKDVTLWSSNNYKLIRLDPNGREGKYLDNFYLPLFKIRKNNPGYYAPMAVSGDFLYLLEADEDDLISLVKYEIGGD